MSSQKPWSRGVFRVVMDSQQDLNTFLLVTLFSSSSTRGWFRIAQLLQVSVPSLQVIAFLQIRRSRTDNGAEQLSSRPLPSAMYVDEHVIKLIFFKNFSLTWSDSWASIYSHSPVGLHMIMSIHPYEFLHFYFTISSPSVSFMKPMMIWSIIGLDPQTSSHLSDSPLNAAIQICTSVKYPSIHECIVVIPEQLTSRELEKGMHQTLSDLWANNVKVLV